MAGLKDLEAGLQLAEAGKKMTEHQLLINVFGIGHLLFEHV